MAEENNNTVQYTDDNIRHLSDMEHVRTRPGMYIGRLGDGNLPEDGIYVLLKEVVDNSIDEFKMGAGARLEIDIEDNLRVSVRDYGRGIPQGKLVEAVSVLNTGGKYDSKAFKKSVGLNGVGVKAVNALSSHFEVKSFREGKVRHLVFERGILKSDKTSKTEDENGTYIFFEPDNTLFKNYSFHDDIVETMLRNYTYLNTGLTIMHNGRRILSRHGLQDLLTDNMTNDGLYDIVHMKGEDIEVAFTHTNQYGEEYYSFVNGQHTTQGGTHQSAFKEHIAKTIKEFFGKYEYGDIRNGLVAAIAINVEEPVFESQTKIKLGSTTMTPNGGETINKYVGDFLKKRWTTICTSIKTWPRFWRARSRRVSASERRWLVSPSWRASVPRRPICTTASCATAASISATPRTNARRKAPSSLQRVILPAEALPRAAT